MVSALGLAVLASLAASRTGSSTTAPALTSGYHLAFVVGAGFAAAAVALAVGVIRATASGAMMHDHAPEQPALDTV